MKKDKPSIFALVIESQWDGATTIKTALFDTDEQARRVLLETFNKEYHRYEEMCYEPAVVRNDTRIKCADGLEHKLPHHMSVSEADNRGIFRLSGTVMRCKMNEPGDLSTIPTPPGT